VQGTDRQPLEEAMTIHIAGTGTTTPTNAIALVTDYITYNETDRLTVWVSEGNQSLMCSIIEGLAGKIESLTDSEIAEPLFTVRSAKQLDLEEEVLSKIDRLEVGPTGLLHEDLGHEDTVLLLFADDAYSEEVLKKASPVNTEVLDLTEGLIELVWEEDEDEPESVQKSVQAVQIQPEATPAKPAVDLDVEEEIDVVTYLEQVQDMIADVLVILRGGE